MIFEYLINKIERNIETIKNLLICLFGITIIFFILKLAYDMGLLEETLRIALYSFVALFVIGEIYNFVNYIKEDYKKFKLNK